MKTIEEKAKEAWENYDYSTKVKWIDVEYMTPPIYTLVLVLRGIGSIPETSFHKRDCDFTAPVGMTCKAVTHWLPIPEQPKSEKGEQA